ncbi:hypothetical protein BH10CHL1_BH10CHL1_02440 [soil metagenome]
MNFVRFSACWGFVLFLFSCTMPVALGQAQRQVTTFSRSQFLPLAEAVPKSRLAVGSASHNPISRLLPTTCTVTRPQQLGFFHHLLTTNIQSGWILGWH